MTKTDFYTKKSVSTLPRFQDCHVPGGSTAGVLAIVHFGSVGRLCGLFERSKAT